MDFAAARFSTCVGKAVHVHSFTGQQGLQVNVGSAHSIDSTEQESELEVQVNLERNCEEVSERFCTSEESKELQHRCLISERDSPAFASSEYKEIATNEEVLGANGPEFKRCNYMYERPMTYNNAYATEAVRDNTSIVLNRTTETIRLSERSTLDDRSVTVQELKTKADEANGLNGDEKHELFDLLVKYKQYFSSKPGKCNLMCYEFNMEDETSIVGSTRPIPFAVGEVREKITQMLDDDIIEPSACLQIELHPRCRKSTPFIFENEVLQFRRVPYGLWNSLPAFVSVLNLAMGADTAEFALSYVDDQQIQTGT
jgi:hypothetical protein